LELNGRVNSPVYADGVNTWGKNINTITISRVVLLQASREVGIEVNTEKRKYMFWCGYQNAGQIIIY
jgi:hypothetical protein